MNAILPKRSEVHLGTDLRLLGSTNPADCVLVLRIMYCRSHVVCLSRSASRSKHRVICAFFGTPTQWPVVVFYHSVSTFSLEDPGEGPEGPTPRLFFDQTEARRAEKSFLRPPPHPLSPHPLSKGLNPPLLTYLWKSFILTGQFAVRKNQRRA